MRRFKDTLKFVYPEATSVLDVGCFSGHWLHFLLQERSRIVRHLGIDVADVKIADARNRFPELQVQVAYAENLDLPDRRFDVVTCLEVLEHIPDWLSVFHSLFRFADKQVLVTVPNREVIEHMACIHCGKLTPRYGHLRSYTEESFPEMRGWRRTFRKIAQREAGRPLAVRLYRTICPYYAWLAVDYRRTT